MYIIAYLVYGGLIIIGKSQCNKSRKHGAKNGILLPPIEDATDIGGSSDYNHSLILEDGP